MFHSEAHVDDIDGRPGWWRLTERLVYSIDDYDEAGGRLKVRVVIPAGFETNLASTPRIMWPILPPFGTYTKATILHDFLYTTKDRFLADALFRVAMRESGTNYFVRLIMFYAVRIFGGRHAKV